MEPFRMGEYWYIRIDGRLIQCESYSAAWEMRRLPKIVESPDYWTLDKLSSK